MWGWKETIIWEEGKGSATPDYDHLCAEEDQNLKMKCITQYGLLGFIQALQLVLWLYRVDGARVEFMSQNWSSCAICGAICWHETNAVLQH